MSNVDITNQALATIGTRSIITAFNDGSQEGLYAGILYNMLRDYMLRNGDFDFAMAEGAAVAVVVAGISWNFGYTYPAGALRIRQAVPAVTDAFDPQPVEWNIYHLNAGTKIVVSKVEIANFIYTVAADESLWDSQFTQAFVQLLASALTMALENRLEASEAVLKNALTFAGIADMRDD